MTNSAAALVAAPDTAPTVGTTASADPESNEGRDKAKSKTDKYKRKLRSSLQENERLHAKYERLRVKARIMNDAGLRLKVFHPPHMFLYVHSISLGRTLSLFSQESSESNELLLQRTIQSQEVKMRLLQQQVKALQEDRDSQKGNAGPNGRQSHGRDNHEHTVTHRSRSSSPSPRRPNMQRPGDALPPYRPRRGSGGSGGTERSNATPRGNALDAVRFIRPSTARRQNSGD